MTTQIYMLWISKAIAENAIKIIPKEIFEKYQIKLDEKSSNAEFLAYTMRSNFDKKDLVEIDKRFKTRSLNEKKLTVKNIFSIYDISEETPIEPTTTSTNNNMDDRYATKEELKQVEVKLTSKMDANKADTDAKLDANQAENNAKFEKMNTKIDANQVENNAKFEKTNAKIDAVHTEVAAFQTLTMAMLAELKKMITDISNSNVGTKQ